MKAEEKGVEEGEGREGRKMDRNTTLFCFLSHSKRAEAYYEVRQASKGMQGNNKRMIEMRRKKIEERREERARRGRGGGDLVIGRDFGAEGSGETRLSVKIDNDVEGREILHPSSQGLE